MSPPKFYLDVLDYFTTRATDVATVEELEGFLCDHATNADPGIAIHLHHSTLPKLATVGLLDYDPRTNTARYQADRAVDAWVSQAVASDGAAE